MRQLSVTALVRYLKNKLDTDSNLQRICVAGEISNYHRHYSGHLYFTLKDESAAISCVMFKSSAASLTFEPKTGDKVILTANTSLFETSGQLQLYVVKMALDGEGELYQKYEILKKKLQVKGIFDEDHKIELEKEYVDKVAVLVGDKSAAMSDIKTTFARRWPLCKVDYYPVLVQGENAPGMIIEKLKEVDTLGYDAIILARGGGSFEDLFCFNDEALVMCIYKLKTFIITGIGHEQDFTLADFVADQRAATPTATVELITPDYYDVVELLDDYSNTLTKAISDRFNNIKMNFDYYLEKLLHYQSHIDMINSSIDKELIKINNAIKIKIENYRLNLKRYTTLLDAYSSDNTLKRGYTLVLQDGKLVKTKKKLLNKAFEVKFIDGTVKAIKE